MPKIIEICDVNSEGHKVRLSDGSYRLVLHNAGLDLQLGAELDSQPHAFRDLNPAGVTIVDPPNVADSPFDLTNTKVLEVNSIELPDTWNDKHLTDGQVLDSGPFTETIVTIPASTEFLNSDAQVAANILSEQMKELEEGHPGSVSIQIPADPKAAKQKK